MMGSTKLDLRYSPKNFEQSVDKYFNMAFGPSPSLYRRVSLCGWRPLSYDSNRLDISRGHIQRQAPAPTGTKPPGIAVYETPEGMTIEVALTIIKEESLHLSILDKKLVIRGETILTSPEKGSYAMATKQHAQFQHFIPLPASISAGGFRAQLKGDVVRIEFDKHF